MGRDLLLFLVPGHLDVLEDLLVGGVGGITELLQFEDHPVEFGKAEPQGILIWKLVHQSPGDLLVILPGEFHGETFALGGLVRQTEG